MSPFLRRGKGRPTGSKRKPMSPIAIGVIAAAIVVLGAYASFTKDIPFKHGTRIDIMFRTSNQLIKGSPVRIAGVEAGKVTGLKPGPDGTTQIVRVELKKSALPIHADATARIRPRLFLEGGFYVELRPGSPSGKDLGDKSVIPVTQTSGPVQFNQILSELDTPVRQSLRTTVRELDTALDGGGAEGFGRVSKPLAPLLRDGSRVAEAARGTRPHDLSEFIADSATTAKAIASSREQLGQMITAFNVTTGALSDNDAALSASIRELDGLLQVSPAAFTALDRALPSLNQTSRDIRPALPLLPGVLSDGAKLLVQLRLASQPSELPLLINNLKPALARLPQLETRLRVLFPLVQPVTDCLRDNVLPVLNAKVPDGGLSTNYPVYLDLAHALVGLAGASGNFDGNGPSVRYNAGVGPAAVSLLGLPSIDTLTGSAEQPLVGANPRWLGRGVKTQKRPDQTCRNQAPVNLSSRTAQTTSAASIHAVQTRRAPQTKPRLTEEQFKSLLAQVSSTTADTGTGGQ